MKNTLNQPTNLDAKTIFESAKSLYKQGKLKEALESFQQASTKFSDRPSDLIEVNLRISDTLMDMGQVDACINNLNHTLKIFQDNFKSDHPLLARIYNFLSRPHRSRNQNEKAKQFGLKALEICQKKLKENDIEFGRTYHNLGSCAYCMDQLGEAEKWLKKAIEIKKNYTGEDCNFELGISYQRLGTVFERYGEYDLALQNLEKGLESLQKYYQCSHPDINAAYYALGNLLLRTSDYEKALKYYEILLKSCLELHGEKHYRTANAYHGLGEAFLYLDFLEDANENLLKAIELYQKTLGEYDSNLATVYISLGQTYYSQNKYVEALTQFMKALRIYRHSLSDQDSMTQNTFDNLECLMSKLKVYELAFSANRKIVLFKKKIYGDKHPFFQAKLRDSVYFESNLDVNSTNLFHANQFV